MRALVLAGGGMRAAYASGVTVALQESGERFDAVYGTSAGGAMGAWFTAGQAHLGTKTFAYAADPRILDYRRYLTRRGPLLDLDRLYRHIYPKEVGFDVERLRSALNPAFVTASNVQTGQCHYIDVRRVPDPYLVLKATSSLPFLASGPVPFDGGLFLDGGILEPLPLRRAIEDGATDIIAVFNRPIGEYRSESRPITWLAGRRYPMLYEAMRRHGRLYHDAHRLATAPPDGVRIRILSPRELFGVSRLTREADRIGRLIAAGRADADRLLAS